MIKYIFLFCLISTNVLAADYFAEIDDNGNVVRIIVADQKFIDSGKVGDPKKWVQTFVDGKDRKNYAGIGYKYDKQLNVFIPPKPFNSWLLDNEKAQWKAPKELPQDGKDYIWDENIIDWKEHERLASPVRNE